MTWHKPADCEICSVLESHPTATNAEVKSLGGGIWGERTIRRHRNTPRLDDVDPFFNVPTSIVTSRGKSTRLPDGSWEKITYRPQDGALLNALQYDDVAELIRGFTAEAEQTSDTDHTEVFGLADAQIGKGGETGGGSLDTVARVLASANRFATRVKKSQPRSIVVTDLGDVIEGIWNVPTHQLSTNDLELVEQIRVARRLYLEIFKLLAPLAPKVYGVFVPSNHGQVRNAPGSQVGTVQNDLGLEISYQLEDVFSNAESPALRNVVFVRPDTHQETAVLDVSGTKLAFNHGHRTKGGINGHDSWWANQDHGRLPGWNADILVVAHYHTLRLEQSGDGRWIICVSASEPSSDYFARLSGKRSKRGVTCFKILDGVWSDLEIL